MNFKYKHCHESAEAGDLEELKRMHLSGCMWGGNTPANAAANGHFECLKYVHENGCPWDWRTPARAAMEGHLECLKYVHENGCPWDDYTPANAAWNGHLECLKYLHENGCPWNSWTPKHAAQNGHLECFKYCFEKWYNPQDFWNINFNLSKIIDKIDLDDPVWRRLFNLDLSKHPKLESKVEDKKKEIEEMKEASKGALKNILPMDVIKYCIHTYF